MEAYTDRHLLGEQFDDILSNELATDSFEPVWPELRLKMVEVRVRGRGIFAGATQCGNRGPVGVSADENLAGILGIDFSVVYMAERNFLVKPIDE